MFIRRKLRVKRIKSISPGWIGARARGKFSSAWRFNPIRAAALSRRHPAPDAGISDFKLRRNTIFLSACPVDRRHR